MASQSIYPDIGGQAEGPFDSLKDTIIQAGKCPECGRGKGEKHHPNCLFVVEAVMIPTQKPMWPVASPSPPSPGGVPVPTPVPDPANTTSPSGAHTATIGAEKSTGGVSCCPKCKGKGWVIKDILSGSTVRCECVEGPPF